MAFMKNVLCAVNDFLNEAQKLGFVKEFTLIQSEQMNENAVPEAEKIVSEYLDKIRCLSLHVDNNCLIAEDDKVTKDEQFEGNKVVESLTEKIDSVQLQDTTNEASRESSNSSITEYIEVIDDVKKSASVSPSHSSAKENSVQNQDDMNEVLKESESHCIKNNLVQIQVDTNEMKRRISAFITLKRKEVDEWNVQEFCGRSYLDEQDPSWEQSNSCARVDAVFVPRRGSKSHIKVSKVRNICGPQSQLQSEAKKVKQEPGEVENNPDNASMQAIEERLRNMESHLKLNSDSSVRSNIFQRLKNLENRILLLESISPEYRHLPNSDYSSPQMKGSISKEKLYLNCSVYELKKKIQTLKECIKATEPHVKTDTLFL